MGTKNAGDGLARPELVEAAIAEAYGAAAAFVDRMGTLAHHARYSYPRPDKPNAWKELGPTFASTFIAWFDLTHFLTPPIRAEARRVYPPGAPSIKLGKLRPSPSLIEALADELGVMHLRNPVYAGRRPALEPDVAKLMEEAKAQGQALDDLLKKETRAVIRGRLGLKTHSDVTVLLIDEWKDQDQAHAESALRILRCGRIDFDDLAIQLGREAQAVAKASKPGRNPKPLIVPISKEEATPKNILLARVRTAFIESGGDVKRARASLANDPDFGLVIPSSSFYYHLKALDKKYGDRWREAAVSKDLGKLENREQVRKPRKPRAN